MNKFKLGSKVTLDGDQGKQFVVTGAFLEDGKVQYRLSADLPTMIITWIAEERLARVIPMFEVLHRITSYEDAITLLQENERTKMMIASGLRIENGKTADVYLQKYSFSWMTQEYVHGVIVLLEPERKYRNGLMDFLRVAFFESDGRFALFPRVDGYPDPSEVCAALGIEASSEQPNVMEG
jgi:hypothetical protein